MKHKKNITILTIILAAGAAAAAAAGILSRGPGEITTFTSIRGLSVPIYAKGLYKHMSSDVAIQGIAQDYITLFAAVPLLIVSLLLSRRGSLRARFILAGTHGYLFVTYLFYLCMAMYNELFLLYVLLTGTAFFALSNSLFSLSAEHLSDRFSDRLPNRFAGGLLIGNALLIALLWLSSVVPPLLDGSLYPAILQHYTTLIVQGMDLGLLLPLSAAAGYMLYRRTEMGLLIGPVYLMFLSILMAALIAKLIAMSIHGVPVMPAIVIIPAIFLITSTTLLRTLKQVSDQT